MAAKQIKIALRAMWLEMEKPAAIWLLLLINVIRNHTRCKECGTLRETFHSSFACMYIYSFLPNNGILRPPSSSSSSCRSTFPSQLNLSLDRHQSALVAQLRMCARLFIISSQERKRSVVAIYVWCSLWRERNAICAHASFRNRDKLYTDI